eukprot:s144_g34.t1
MPLNLDLSVPVVARSVYTVLPKQLVKRLSFGNPWAASPPFAHCWPSRMGLSHCQGAGARSRSDTWSRSGANQLRSHQPGEKKIGATWCRPTAFDNMLRYAMICCDMLSFLGDSFDRSLKSIGTKVSTFYQPADNLTDSLPFGMEVAFLPTPAGVECPGHLRPATWKANEKTQVRTTRLPTWISGTCLVGLCAQIKRKGSTHRRHVVRLAEGKPLTAQDGDTIAVVGAGGNVLSKGLKRQEAIGYA